MLFLLKKETRKIYSIGSNRQSHEVVWLPGRLKVRLCLARAQEFVPAFGEELPRVREMHVDVGHVGVVVPPPEAVGNLEVPRTVERNAELTRLVRDVEHRLDTLPPGRDIEHAVPVEVTPLFDHRVVGVRERVVRRHGDGVDPVLFREGPLLVDAALRAEAGLDRLAVVEQGGNHGDDREDRYQREHRLQSLFRANVTHFLSPCL